MRRFLLYFFLFWHFTLFISCKKDKLKAPKASFLVVNNVTIKTTSIQGFNSHNIVDMWYYVDGEFKGVFPVGGVMPIISSGTAEITLFAGIKNNGISSTRLPYAAFSSKIYHIDIEPGKTYTISPEFEYNTSAFFYYADGLNNSSFGGSYFNPGNSNCQTTSDPSKVFSGAGCVVMTMTDAIPSTSMVQASGTYLPDGGAVIYVELDYKCNQEFNVGVIGYNGSGSPDIRDVVTVTSSDEWKHIYIQLTKTVSTAPTYGSYKVYIEAKKATDTPEIYIDNVKLIYQ